MSKSLTESERELLLTQTAAVRSAQSEKGAGVVLVPANRTLCSCQSEDDAKLIVKLFNGAEIMRPHL